MSKKVECDWLESGADRENINKHACVCAQRVSKNMETNQLTHLWARINKTMNPPSNMYDSIPQGQKWKTAKCMFYVAPLLP